MSKIFITLILFLGSLVIGSFYLVPQWRQFSALQTETENLREISAQLDELISNRDALTKTINAVSRADLAKIDLALPQGPHSADFLVLLETLAKKNQVILKQVNLSETAGGTGGLPKPGGSVSLPGASAYQELPITLNINGSYDSFKAFLKDLERNLRVIDIQSITFGGSSTNQFELNLRGKTYYQ